MRKLLLLALLFSLPAQAIPLGSGGGPSGGAGAQAPAKPLIHPRVAKEKAAREALGEADREIDWSKVALAPAASLVLGFGLGQAIQQRLNGYAIAYPVADGIGWLLVVSAMGSCPRGGGDCKKGRERRHNIGLILLGASRLAQVIDSGIWGYRYWRDGGEPKVSLLPVPVEGGAALSVGFRF